VLVLIEVVGEVLRDEAIEKCAKNVLLEVPAVDTSAEVICDLPDRLWSSARSALAMGFFILQFHST
jgi:hypothetical protein